jgi:hypothetical protein
MAACVSLAPFATVFVDLFIANLLFREPSIGKPRLGMRLDEGHVDEKTTDLMPISLRGPMVRNARFGRWK